MVLERMRGNDLSTEQVVEQLKGIRETLLAKLRDAGNESKYSHWELFKNIFPLIIKDGFPLTVDRLFPEMTIVNLKGEWRDAEVKVKISAGVSKSLMQEKGNIAYPVIVNVTMGEEQTKYFLTPNLHDSESHRFWGADYGWDTGDFESCLELGQLTELIKTDGLQVVENS